MLPLYYLINKWFISWFESAKIEKSASLHDMDCSGAGMIALISIYLI
jgi:hypothetical protein